MKLPFCNTHRQCTCAHFFKHVPYRQHNGLQAKPYRMKRALPLLASVGILANAVGLMLLPQRIEEVLQLDLSVGISPDLCLIFAPMLGSKLSNCAVIVALSL